MNPDLITLEELKVAFGYGDTDALRDKKFEKAIHAASNAVRKFADRSFGIPVTTAIRVFEFDPSGYMDIDDAVKVNEVKFKLATVENLLDPYYWRAEPQDGPPYNYLVLPKWAGIYSPQMGFRENLDRISQEPGWPGVGPQVAVNAEWGWPEVPEDVRQAVILTAAYFQEKPDKYIQESIAGYSITSQPRSGTAGAPTAIPSQAQDLLAPYVRMEL